MDAKVMTKAANMQGNGGINIQAVKPPTETVGDLLNKYYKAIAESLGDEDSAKRFLRVVINVIARDPKLLQSVKECPASLIGAVLQCAQLGLEPNTPMGLCYLIPYYEKDKVASAKQGKNVYVMRVNFQLGYQGVLNLAYRSTEVSYVTAEEVYERDFFDYQLGTNPYIKHIPYDGAENPGKIVKYYAIVKLKNGEPLFKVWRTDKVIDHARKFAKSYDNKADKFFGPWDNNFSSMAKKTVLLDTLKYAPKSTTFANKLTADNSTKSVPSTGSMINIDMLAQTNEASLENADNVPQIETTFTDTPKSAKEIREQFGLKSGSDVTTPKPKPAAKETATNAEVVPEFVLN